MKKNRQADPAGRPTGFLGRKGTLMGCTLLLAAALAGCGTQQPQPQQTTAPTQPAVETVELVVTADTIGQLTQYPALKAADLTGSTCYGEIEAYSRANPQVALTYTVDIGGLWVPHETEQLIIGQEQYDYALLLENIPHLKNLRELTLIGSTLSAEQMDALSQAGEELTVSFTTQIAGREYDSHAEEVDLSACPAEEIMGLIPMLKRFTDLKTIRLMDGNGESQLTLEEAAALARELPQAEISFSFDLFGVQVSTEDTRVEIVNRRIRDEAVLRQAMDLLKKCEYMLLVHTGLSNETLAQIREDYRHQTKVVWRVYFGDGGSCLTDREVIRSVYGVYNTNSEALAYCEDCRFLDLGHNEFLSDCSFIAGMPNLEAVILSGSPIRDLTPFSVCKNLEILEIAYCSYITDLSAVAACENLKAVNIAYTGISDLSALDDLAIDRLVACHSGVGEEEQQRFAEKHPEAITLYTGTQPYGYPWRTEEDGTPTVYYQKMKDAFHYPNTENTTW